MVYAKTLLDEIRQNLQPVKEQPLGTRYVQALEEGKIGQESLRLFAGEQYIITASDGKASLVWLAASGARRAVIFFLASCRAKELPGTTSLTFAHALGLSEIQLRDHEPLPGAHANTLPHGMARARRPDAEVPAAYVANFPAWG